MSTDTWSHIVQTQELTPSGKTFKIEAASEQCVRIAERLDIPAVLAVEAVITAKPIKGGVVFEGELEADIERICVASLDKISETIKESFRVEFLENPDTTKDGEDIIFDDKDWEKLENHEIDLGDFLIQQISLAMSPYPRKDGATNLSDEYGKVGDVSPFSVLKSLQSGSENKH